MENARCPVIFDHAFSQCSPSRHINRDRQVQEETSNASTVWVNGAALREDRKNAGYTQTSFASACGSVSVATIRRAEAGRRVFRSALSRMAEVLGREIEDYFAPDMNDPTSLARRLICGEWAGFSVETDNFRPPYVVRHDMTFAAEPDGTLRAEAVTRNLNPNRRATMPNGQVHGNCLTGRWISEDLERPNGEGTTTLRLLCDGSQLEGFTIWMDPVSGVVECSRSVLVRKGMPETEAKTAQALEQMERECRMYALRKLIEQGHDVDMACAMLPTAESGAA